MLTYEYDSWGVPVSVTDNSGCNLSVLNPFRYRGYVYDDETGYYYLKSRYYDPESGRFLSADHVDMMLDSRNTLIGKNLYAYCENNPIIYVDPLGRAIEWGAVLTAAAIGAIISVGISAAVAGAVGAFSLNAGVVVNVIGGVCLDIRDEKPIGVILINALIGLWTGRTGVEECFQYLGLDNTMSKIAESFCDVVLGLGSSMLGESVKIPFNNKDVVGYKEDFHYPDYIQCYYFGQKGYQNQHHQIYGYRNQYHNRINNDNKSIGYIDWMHRI